MPIAPDKLYEAVKSGRIDPRRLSDQHKAELKGYVQSKNTPSPPANMGLLRQNDVVAPPAGMGGLRANDIQPPRLGTPRTYGAAGAPVDVIPESFQQNHPTASKVAYTALKPIDFLASNPFSKRVAQSANETRFIYTDPNKTDTGSAGLNTAADLGGGVLGFLSGGELGVGGKAFDTGVQGFKTVTSKLPSLPTLAGKISPRLAPVTAKVSPYLASGAELVAGGLTYEGIKAGSTGESFTPEDAAKVGLENLLAGVVFRGAGNAVSKLRGNLSKRAEEEIFDTGRDLGEQITAPRLGPRSGGTVTTELPVGTPAYLQNYLKNAPRSGGNVKTKLPPKPVSSKFLEQSARSGGTTQTELPSGLPAAYNLPVRRGPSVPSLYKQRFDFQSRAMPEPTKPTTEIKASAKTEALPPVVDVGDKIFTGDATKLKDVGGWRSYMTDVYRNFKAVFGKDYEAVKKRVLDPFDDSKKANVLHQEEWLGKLKSEVVDRLGIKKGSKESALVQQYGEKKITLEELKQQRPNDWQKIVEADKWFRQAYDNLIDEVNAVRRQIYPNAENNMASIKAKIEATKANKKLTQAEKQEKVAELEAKLEEAMRGKFVPKRQDYYRHFNDMAEGFAGLKNIFDTPANIDPKLAGISDFTQPKGRFAGFMQKRGLGPYKNDAVGGFLNYIPAASYSIHIDPHVSKFSNLADELSEATTDSRNINNFINFLRKYSQDLAGKTNPADRFIQEVIPGGRMTFNAVNWLNNRVKANTVLANAGSALAQLANVPLGIAHSKQYAVPGVGKTLKSIFFDNKDIAQSGFIKERFGSYGSKMYRQFDTRLIDQPKKMAVWLMETADKMGTHFIWNSAYTKAIAEGAKDPVRQADAITRSLVAGRGVGEVPLLQKSKLFQIVAPFQLEVANLWSVQRDFVKAKDFGALVTLYLGSYLFNKIAEETRGSGVVFDPVQAMIDAVTEEDISLLERGGRLAGEVLSNVPLGQTIAAMYPEYGTTIGDYQLPTRKKLFGRADPTRFGGGPLVVKGAQDPFFKLVPPFGGNQLKKTSGGIAALKTNSVDDKKGNIKYPVAPNLANRTKGILFGPGAFREAKDYYRNDRRPLSEKQTAELRASGNDQQEYAQLMLQREMASIDRKITDIDKDPKISREEKDKQIMALIKKRDNLIGGGK